MALFCLWGLILPFWAPILLTVGFLGIPLVSLALEGKVVNWERPWEWCVGGPLTLGWRMRGLSQKDWSLETSTSCCLWFSVARPRRQSLLGFLECQKG